jgi:thiol:disulfide interchange protein DsbD
MKDRFIMVKADVTKGGNPVHERLLEQYDVKGVPTIVFLDSDGQERRDLRLVDFLSPDRSLGSMAQIRNGASQRKENENAEGEVFLE